MARAEAADAVVFGAVGGPKWSDVPYEARPEAGLLRLRKDLGLFANLRPAVCYPALADASSLKRELVEGLDIMIVRELTGGVYFGEPKEIVTLESGERRAVDTQVYHTHEIERIARVAFDLARVRRNKVTSSEKNNVMKSGVLWKQVVTALHKADYPDVDLDHMLADNCGMQLVRSPKQFDVIVCDNLFGDMLSDVAAMLTGSLGMLPSASLGAWTRRPASARRCTSRCTAPRPTSPARVSPTRSRRSPPSGWRCATPSASARSPTGSTAPSLPFWGRGCAPRTSRRRPSNAVSTSEMGKAVVEAMRRG